MADFTLKSQSCTPGIFRMNPFAGRLGWVWDVNAQFARDINMVIADAKAAHCQGVLIKSNDDGRVWFQANRENVEALHAADLRCIYWGYSYGDVNGFCDAAVRVVLSTKCDGYVVDGEAELRNSGKSGLLARTLRERLGDFPLGFAPLPIMRFHRALDYPAWADAGYTLMPQVYSNVLGPQTYPAPGVIREWREAFPDAALAPIYGTYSALENGFNVHHPTPEMMAGFLAACDEYGAIGHSFWRLDTLDLSTLPPEADDMQLTEQERADLTVVLGTLWGLAGKLRAKRDRIIAEASIVRVKEIAGLE